MTVNIFSSQPGCTVLVEVGRCCTLRGSCIPVSATWFSCRLSSPAPVPAMHAALLKKQSSNRARTWPVPVDLLGITLLLTHACRCTPDLPCTAVLHVTEQQPHKRRMKLLSAGTCWFDS